MKGMLADAMKGMLADSYKQGRRDFEEVTCVIVACRSSVNFERASSTDNSFMEEPFRVGFKE